MIRSQRARGVRKVPATGTGVPGRVLCLAMGLVFLAGAALAGETRIVVEKDPGKKEIKKEVKVVKVEKDGEGQSGVMVFSGDDGKTTVLPLGGKRGYLGVAVVNLTPELRRHFGAPQDAGVMVSKVDADSPAAKAGVAVGDVVTRVGDQSVASFFDLKAAIAPHKAGDKVTVEAYRDGKKRQLPVTVAEHEAKLVDLGYMMRSDDKGRKVLIGSDLGGDDGMQTLRWRAEGDHSEKIEAALEKALGNIDDGDLEVVLERQQKGRADLEKRLAALEKKLADLEKQLEEEHHR